MQMNKVDERVLVLGVTSLVGSHFAVTWHRGVLEAAGRREPQNFGLTVSHFTPINLGDEEGVRRLIRETECNSVVNYASRTDVDGCERERPEDPCSIGNPPKESAWIINAELPGWVAEECATRGIFMVQISTDFVFDGTSGPYSEDASPSPFSKRIGWYGFTKAIGECRVTNVLGSDNSAIVRITHPYGPRFEGKLDFAWKLLQRQRVGQLYPLYTDQQLTPTWIPDVSETVGRILASRSGGIYHVASPSMTTPYEFSRALFKEFGYNPDAIEGCLLSAANPSGRVPRPLKGGLRVRNILKLGIQPVDFRSGIRLMTKE